MNFYDAASIAYPFRERDLDPPTQYWTDANERDYAAWLESCRAEMEHEFALDRDDAFDEFCRDKFDAEHADDGYDDDLAYEQSREVGAP